MRKRITSLLLVLALCLALLPTAALAEGPEAGNGTAVQAVTAERTESSVASVVIGGETNYYNTLNEAIAAAYNADNGAPLTVTLLKNEASLSYPNTGDPRCPAIIDMGGNSLSSVYFCYKPLTLNNGMVSGTWGADVRSGGGLVLTAPTDADAAITGPLSIVYIWGEGSGTANVSGAKIGVKGKLIIENSAAGAVVISGSDKAVELSKEASLPDGCCLYGSAEENGSPDTVAVYDADQKTYTVNGEVAKKLVSGPRAVVAVTPGDIQNVMAGEAQEYTAQYTAEGVVTGSVKGLGDLQAEVENADANGITVDVAENAADGTWKVTVRTAEATPLGTYTLNLSSAVDGAVSGSVSFTVSETKYAASVGGQNYRSLSAAIDAAKVTNGTVTLLDNVTDSITVTGGKFTIDLNGKTWTGASDSYALTVDGGEVTVSSTDETGTIISSYGNKHAIWINGGTVNLKKNVKLEERLFIDESAGGSVTFEPGVTVTQNIMTSSSYITEFLTGLALQNANEDYVPFYNVRTNWTPLGYVTVVAHDNHNMVDGVCNQCGYICDHSGAKDTDTTCLDCGATFIAAATAADGTVTRYTNADAALAAAAKSAKIEFVEGTYTLKSMARLYGSAEIDLNEATLQYASGDYDAVLWMEDSSASTTIKNGTIRNTDEGTGVYLYKGSLTLENVTVIGGTDEYYGYSVHMANNNTLTVKSGSFTGPLDLNLTNSTVKLYGGTYQDGIKGYDSITAEGYAALLDNSDPAKQYAYADKATGAVISYETVATRMNDGDNSNNSIQVVEHTHTMGDANTCTECGFVCTSHKYEKGVCAICHAECPHANVNTSTHVCSDCDLTMVAAATVKDSENNDVTIYTADLAAAMNKAADGTTFTLLADVTLNEYIEVAGETAKTLTLDLQDHTIHNAKFSIGEIDVNEKAGTAGTLKITGSGSLLNEEYTAILVWEDGKLDLTDWKDGTISGVGLGYNTKDSVAGKAVPQIIVGEDAGCIGSLMFKNWYVSSISASTLEGGSYDQITMNTDQQSVNIETLLPTGYAFQKNDGTLEKRITTIATGGVISSVSVVKCTAHEDTDGDKKCDYCNADLEAAAVATLTVDGKTYFYTDLPSAIAKANTTGGSIQLRQDVTGLTEKLDINHTKPFDITLDLNGHTISGSDSSGSNLLAVSTFMEVTICDSSTAKTGKITSTKGGYAVCVSSGKLTITGGTFEGADDAQISAPGYAAGVETGGELIITGGTFNSPVVARDKLTVSGGTFEKAVNITAGRATISGGTFEDAVSITAGGATISGGTFEGAVSITATPAALSGGTFKEQVTFNIGGGTMTRFLSGGTFEKGLSTNYPGLVYILVGNYLYKVNNRWERFTTTSSCTDLVTVEEVPIRFPVNLIAYPGSKEYGKSQDITLYASCAGSAEDLYVGWFLVHANGTQTLVSNDGKGLTKVENKSATYTLPAGLAIGTHTYRVFFCDKNVQDGENTPSDAYTETADITIEITKIDLANAEVTIAPWPEDGKVTFNPNTETPVLIISSSGVGNVITVNGTDTLNSSDYTYEGATATEVGKYTLTITATDACEKYKGSKTFEWEVVPFTLPAPEFVGNQTYTKTYDGTTALPESYTFNAIFPSVGINPQVRLTTDDYEVNSASFVSADAGENKPINQTITLKNKNFVFASTEAINVNGITTTDKTITYTNWTPTTAYPSVGTTFNIEKADVEMTDAQKTVSLEVINDLEATYTVDLPGLPALPDNCKYGSIRHAVDFTTVDKLTNGYNTIDHKTVGFTTNPENGKTQLTFTVPAVKNPDEGSIGAIQIKVETDNYKDVILTVNLNAVNRPAPKVTIIYGPATITYGMTLADIKLDADAIYDTELVSGTIAWDEDTTALWNVGTHNVKWKFTPQDTTKYRETTGMADITVTPATPTGEPTFTKITQSGKMLADAALTTNESWPEGALQWVDKDGKALNAATTEVKANTAYQWKFTPDSKNYDPIEGSITLYYVSTGGGGSTTYPVSTPSKTENGTVTVSPKNASRGDTVTITVKPDSGYVLGSLTVTDSKGNELKLTDKGDGKYTFTMPAGKVEVKASFAKEIETSPFADVATDAYYYEAVKWAVKNGITTGVGDNLFAPGQPCTRAQIVTFLWRAAGSPEPEGTAAGMTDVVTGSYYEKAVAWAIENGVTTGTTATTFSPDATCTRAQAVTFLARALNAKATSTAEFSDVPTDSYFAEAVAWAAANGVTTGIGGGLFGPNNNCTRAQIVTFLWRAYTK